MIAIDDLPSVGVSRLRASGHIRPEDKTTTVTFGDLTFTVALALRRFPNGGSWSFFVCACGHQCRTLRLYEGKPVCRACLEAKGFHYRAESLPPHQRAAYRVLLLKRRLSAVPARLNPRPGRTLDRRKRLEAVLWRAEYVAARHWFADPIGKGDGAED
jgi:hypothetical protein